MEYIINKKLANKYFPLPNNVIEVVKLVRERETLILSSFVGEVCQTFRIVEIDNRLAELVN